MSAPSASTGFNVSFGDGNSTYGYEITATGGTSRAILATPEPGGGDITAGQVTTLAGDLKTALLALADVTAVTQTSIELSVSTGSYGQALYGGALWQYNLSGVPPIVLDSTWACEGFFGHKSGIYGAAFLLYTSSPGDSVLSSSDLTSVFSSFNSSLAGISGITSVTQQSAPTITGLPS